MRTPHSATNARLTDKGHELAQGVIYPRLFNAPPERLIYDTGTLLKESARGAILDGELATDHVVRVKRHDLRAPVPFTIQERFRRHNFARYRDLTITEWNPLSNTPSELYKLGALYFVYGYLNETLTDFIEVVCVSTLAMLRGIVTGVLPYRLSTHNPRTRQPFVTIKFDDLLSHGAIDYHYTPAKNIIAFPGPMEKQKGA